LDACALIAVLAMENGADNIRKLFQKAIDRQIVLIMSKFNFLEVYYKISIADSIAVAETIRDLFDNPVGYRISLAKCSAFCRF
jgi:PIN domain nuclease of toxin-antitoxin system